ncbi:MAG TPA: acetyl-CoA acetyltransferase [Caulobacteraceae bacterium]|jgi:acetyl-CoA C-acetyltransferase
MDLTPVLVGVGEASERIEVKGYEALSPADLAGRAAHAALEDALSVDALARHIDVIATVRQFETSHPRAVAPFGKSDNFPRAIARRIGADPKRAIVEPVGGQGPQHLVNEFANAIGAGEAGMVLLAGAEAISTQRHLMAAGQTRNWSETVGGEIEDRGYGDSLSGSDLPKHGARTAISLYALFENARRGREGLSRTEYQMEMGRLFAPFTEVAAGNPHAMSREILTIADIATVTPSNRITSDPFPRRVVSRDQTNQGAAVLLTSVGLARELGVPEDRFIYLHGGADARERTPMERADLSKSPAAVMAVRAALNSAGLTLAEIDLFDFYSCFPIAVFNVRDGLGIAPNDPRPLTMTGGLPFFGGAGNNYSMHAIAALVRALRRRSDAFGLVAANGGFLSKYSVGVYGAKPGAWCGFDSIALQAEVDSWAAPEIGPGTGWGTIETYTIDHAAKPPAGVAIGRLDDANRFVARTDPEDDQIVRRMMSEEPLGARVQVSLDADGRSIIREFQPRSGE